MLASATICLVIHPTFCGQALNWDSNASAAAVSRWRGKQRSGHVQTGDLHDFRRLGCGGVGLARALRRHTGCGGRGDARGLLAKISAMALDLLPDNHPGVDPASLFVQITALREAESAIV